MLPSLTIVVPCYNEEEVLPIAADVLEKRLSELIAKKCISTASLILFVDDGSKDETWNIIHRLSQVSSKIAGIKLSRNVGHQNALVAGLENVNTDICVSIDADLQDDVCAIDEMVARYHEGYQVVYGVRHNRTSDTFFKRETAKYFYRVMAFLGVETVDNHADFRLLGKAPLKALLSLTEVNAYIRGMVPLVGFRSTSVYYDRSARLAGESKYPLKKMIGLAIKGVTSFSVTPLRIIAILGLSISILAGSLSIWVLLSKLFGNPVRGWASSTLVTIFMGGVQMLALGIVGEYIGCIYLEVKKRPKYFVEMRSSFSGYKSGEDNSNNSEVIL